MGTFFELGKDKAAKETDEPIKLWEILNFSLFVQISLRDGWLDDMQFYVLFISISVISGRWEVDNERLYAMELRLRLRKFRPERRPNSVR